MEKRRENIGGWTHHVTSGSRTSRERKRRKILHQMYDCLANRFSLVWCWKPSARRRPRFYFRAESVGFRYYLLRAESRGVFGCSTALWWDSRLPCSYFVCINAHGVCNVPFMTIFQRASKQKYERKWQVFATPQETSLAVFSSPATLERLHYLAIAWIFSISFHMQHY